MTVLSNNSNNRTSKMTLILVISLIILSGMVSPSTHASGAGPFVSVLVNGSCGQIISEGEVNITVTVREPSQVKVIVVSPGGSERTIELQVEESVSITLNLTGPPGLWSVLAIANSTLTSTQYESKKCSFVFYPPTDARAGFYTPPRLGSEGSFVSVLVNGSCGQIISEGEVNITVTVREPSQVKVIVVSPVNEGENGFSEILELEPMLVDHTKNITFKLMGPSGLWSVLAIANSTLTLTPYVSNICNIQVIHRKGFKQGKIVGLNVTDIGNKWLLKVTVENNGTLEEMYGLKIINVTGCSPMSKKDIELAPNDTKVLNITCDYPAKSVKGQIILYRADNESLIYDRLAFNLNPKIVPVLNETPIRVEVPGNILLRPGQRGDTFSIVIRNKASTEIEVHPSIQVGSKDLMCETNISLVIPPEGEGELKIKCMTLKEGEYSLRLFLQYYRDDLGIMENLSKLIRLTISSSHVGKGNLRIKSIKPSDLVAGETYRMSIEFENVGSHEMQGINMSLKLRNNLAKLHSSRLYIQSLKPGESKEMRFELETISAGKETLEVLVEYMTESGSLVKDRLEVPLTISSSHVGKGNLRLTALAVAAIAIVSIIAYMLKIRKRS